MIRRLAKDLWLIELLSSLATVILTATKLFSGYLHVEITD